MSNSSNPPTDRFSIALADVRASVVAETPRNRMAEELQRLMLAVIEMLFGLLAQLDARAAAAAAGGQTPDASVPLQAWGAVVRGLRDAGARARVAFGSTRQSCAVRRARGDSRARARGVWYSAALQAGFGLGDFLQFSKNR
jgi:hypothetical protein